MAFNSEVINSVKGSSIIRVADAGTATITLINLRAKPNTETVTAASIKKVTWATNGSISIVRNSNTILSLHNSGEMDFQGYGYSAANNDTSNIIVTIVSGGSIVMEVSKTATYNVDPYTGETL
jgi:hypothetical protein